MFPVTDRTSIDESSGMIGDMNKLEKNKMIFKTMSRLLLNCLMLMIFYGVYGLGNSNASSGEGFIGFSHLNKEMAGKVKKYEKEVNELKEGIGEKVKKYERYSEELSNQAEELKAKAVKENKDFFGDIEKLKKKSGGVSGRRYVFLSFSMPDKVIKEYIKESVVTGYLPVFKGFKEGNYAKTMGYLKGIMESTKSGAEINPEVFKEFNIKEVPSFVIAEGSMSCYESNSCKGGKYNKIAGNIGISGAIRDTGKVKENVRGLTEDITKVIGLVI